MATTPNPRTGDADKPYDWEHYEREWVPNDNYRRQEDWLTMYLGQLVGSAHPPESILEVGPGLGRITKIALYAFPNAEFSAADIANAPLRVADQLTGGLEDEYLGSISSTGFYQSNKRWRTEPGGKKSTYGLVLAIEVLMHVPPEELGLAIENLLMVTKPGGTLITCDWTEPLPPRSDGSPVPIRVMNHRHNYREEFFSRHVIVAQERRIDKQTIFVVKP